MSDFNDTEDEAKLYADMRQELEAEGVDCSDIEIGGSREDGPPPGAGPYGGNDDDGGDDPGNDDEVQRAAMTAEQYLQQMQQGSQQRGPSVDDDPVSYFESRLNSLEQQRSGEQLYNAVKESETLFAQQTPDYSEACEHLENVRRSELEAMYPDNSPQSHLAARQAGFRSPAELRDAQLEHDRISVAMQAVQAGRSPAQLYYDLAKSRGWQGGGKAGGGKGGGKGMSPEKLADLYTEDPEAFDKEFDRMAKAGALG